MSTSLGTVKFFSVANGYGFITPDNGADDVFVHAKDVEKSGLQSLTKGQRVSFDVERGNKGFRAANLSAA